MVLPIFTVRSHYVLVWREKVSNLFQPVKYTNLKGIFLQIFKFTQNFKNHCLFRYLTYVFFPLLVILILPQTAILSAMYWFIFTHKKSPKYKKTTVQALVNAAKFTTRMTMQFQTSFFGNKSAVCSTTNQNSISTHQLTRDTCFVTCFSLSRGGRHPSKVCLEKLCKNAAFVQ